MKKTGKQEVVAGEWGAWNWVNIVVGAIDKDNIQDMTLDVDVWDGVGNLTTGRDNIKEVRDYDNGK